VADKPPRTSFYALKFKVGSAFAAVSRACGLAADGCICYPCPVYGQTHTLFAGIVGCTASAKIA